MDTISIIIIYISAAVELIIGAVVFLSDNKNRVNQLFGIVAIITSYWILTNALITLQPNIIWVRNNYAAGILIAPFIIIWINRFITQKKMNRLGFFLILISASLFSLLTYFTDLVIKNVETSYIGGFVGTYGSLFPVFALYFIFTSGYILLMITRAFYNSSGIQKTQYGYIAVGLYCFGIITAIVSFALPFFGVDIFTPLDSPSSIFFIASMSFAILRYHLFNVKIIATELITFGLWIFILTRILIASNVKDMSIDIGLLLITIVFGIFLIKSVIKEVSQREKIEKLAGDLQKANDRLKELDKQKSEFVSFATHQLRAPLTAMKGYASLILEGDLGKLSHDIRNAITRIYDSSKTLTNIVDDYLNISRIELGSMKYSFETIDLKNLVSDVIAELQPNILKSKIDVSFIVDKDKKFMVKADRDKFKQIITNVIDNSLKYTPMGSMNISLEKIQTDGHMNIRFTVKDTGIGIAPEVLPNLFAKFSRADNASKQNIHGTGLGLYVAKEIVTAHQGKIWAESPGEGKGATFFVELEEAI